MGDQFPQVFAISGMHTRRAEGRFHDLDDFAAAVNDPGFSAAYIFIEPNYGNVLPTTPGDFTGGNSQHPLDDITHGEALIKQVYETIRNSPHWNESLLLVIYDEHGGFFDHVKPPPAVSPGDRISDETNRQHGFDFTQLGVRVPAVAISPLIPAGTIDHTTYDHSSLLATVEALFGLAPLTDRDRQASTLVHLLSERTPRIDAPTSLPEPADSGLPRAAAGAGAEAEPDGRPIEPVLRSFLHVALLRDYRHSSWMERPAVLQRFFQIATRQQALGYLREVAQRVKTFCASVTTPKSAEQGPS
jgi:phospholipase C